jgi:hypothetical protein
MSGEEDEEEEEEEEEEDEDVFTSPIMNMSRNM